MSARETERSRTAEDRTRTRIGEVQGEVQGEAHPDEGHPIEERHIEVPRTARYAALGMGAPEPAEVWIVLHGYRQLARPFLRRFASLDDGTRWIVAPEALSRFYTGTERGRHGPGSRVGATWMTREDRESEIRDYVRYLDLVSAELLGRLPEPVPLTALGFSQGVHTAARWAAYGRAPVARLVLWGEHLPPDLDMQRAAPRYRTMEVVLVRGDADPVLGGEPAASEAGKLDGWGLCPRVLTYAGGHEILSGPLSELVASGPPGITPPAT